jgi:DinB superfamily
MTGMNAIADELEGKLRAAERLRSMSEQVASQPIGPGKWSPKQTIGHLIDSAANNHQRFVRMQVLKHLELEGYDGDAWVKLERYDQRSWREIVGLWESYNRHLAHLIRCVDPGALRHTWKSPEGNIVDLEFVIRDYLVHMQHHLDQIPFPNV